MAISDSGSLVPIGIDVGSTTTKAVLVDGRTVKSSCVIMSSDTAEQSARQAIEETLSSTGIPSDLLYAVATGAGGKSIPFVRQSKSIAGCLARGSNLLLPSVRMLIDMGAESLTVVKLNSQGKLTDWGTHDKCASGTGIFLEQMARLMQMPIEDMAMLSFRANSRADVSSTCAVFAESEVISHIHRVPPTPKEEIVAGIYLAMVHRILTLCKRLGIEPDIAVTGGVALNTGLVSILEEEAGIKTLQPANPQIVAALGAAVFAAESIAKEGRL